ncbi:MAG: hypothetical protein ACTS2F_26695 [Thainema sp.]
MSSSTDRFSESPQSDPKEMDSTVNANSDSSQSPKRLEAKKPSGRVAPPAAENTTDSSEPPSASKPSASAAKPTQEADGSAVAESTTESTTEAAGVEKKPRQQPIPPPSEPLQYRAIGLVRGRYEPSEEQFNRGNIIAEGDVKIDAVLLGRVTSLVKKHLDPEQDHLWVVYPRTREKQNDLHLQIVGVWEPEKLQAKEEEPEPSETGLALRPPQPPQPRNNYFSIRGEVIIYDEDEEAVTVKILQSPKRPTDSTKVFKLNLRGKLPGSRTVGHFWDINARREGDYLEVYLAERVAMMKPRKPRRRDPRSDRNSRGGPPQRPFRKTSHDAPSGSSGASKPVPKPAKRTSSDDSPGASS